MSRGNSRKKIQKVKDKESGGKEGTKRTGKESELSLRSKDSELSLRKEATQDTPPKSKALKIKERMDTDTSSDSAGEYVITYHIVYDKLFLDNTPNAHSLSNSSDRRKSRAFGLSSKETSELDQSVRAGSRIYYKINSCYSQYHVPISCLITEHAAWPWSTIPFLIIRRGER